MKTIPLTQNKIALIDDQDHEDVSQYKWHCCHNNSNFYAQRSIQLPGNKKKNEKMHRRIMGLGFGDGYIVDHINNNGLDNRRSNLRIVNITENNRNRRRLIWHKRPNYSIRHRKRDSGDRWEVSVYLGSFCSLNEARLIRDRLIAKIDPAGRYEFKVGK